MARTPLFDALRRALARADAQRRGAAAPGAPSSGPTRRQFLGTTASALALPLLPSCSGDAGGDGEVIPVVVIGGGIAGLHCAVRLAEAGVDVTVFEASARTGGRMWSRNDLFLDGQVCELGGELVDTGHTTIQGLCTELGLQLDELVPGAGIELIDVFFLEELGQTVSFADLSTMFEPLAARMAATVAATDADDAEFARIDAMSIPQWLEAEGLTADNVLRRCIEIAYVGEYGLEVEQQSVFNLLYLIDYEVPDPFRIYGDSDERYHIHAGSQAVTDGLATRIAERIEREHVLVALTQDGDSYRLTFETPGGEIEIRAQHVVLATPFTALRAVDLTAAGLTAEKLQVIAELGYGTNSKLMLGFATRQWESLRSNGGLFTDVSDIQATWDSSRGQPGTSGILTNFVGGERGVAIGEGTAEERGVEVLADLDLVFAGIAKQYRPGSAVRQHWPSAPFHRGSYACYKPGQWAFYGTEGQRAGNVHFCGEHTSLDFQGYMEGGAETGALVALEVLTDLGVAPSAQLARLLEPKLRLPQAAYRGDGTRLRRSQRRALGAR
jgi:monoamine oxidase